jgi:hypothetical protein
LEGPELKAKNVVDFPFSDLSDAFNQLPNVLTLNPNNKKTLGHPWAEEKQFLWELEVCEGVCQLFAMSGLSLMCKSFQFVFLSG